MPQGMHFYVKDVTGWTFLASFFFVHVSPLFCVSLCKLTYACTTASGAVGVTLTALSNSLAVSATPGR